MSKAKKAIRQAFREAVFARDNHSCRKCQGPGDDAHHITDRTLMPAGGYVVENGITLCHSCHEKAEAFHSTGTAEVGFHPDDLYKLIDSSYTLAVEASQRL